MEYIYETMKTEEIDEEGKSYEVYGIRCVEAQNGTEVISVENIFTSHSDAAELTCLINSLELSPLHFKDVIADALAQM